MISQQNLKRFAAALLRSGGLASEQARIVADSLVDADAAGVTTHGTVRIESYIDLVQSGRVNGDPTARTVAETGTALLIDADRGFGAPIGITSLDRAFSKARSSGISLVSVRNVAHFGTAGFYARYGAAHGFISFAMSSSSPSVTAFGGSAPWIGNSPMSFASPGVDHPELNLDMAQSMTSRGRIRLLYDQGKRLPDGWALDSDGRPTTDPLAALHGAVLPSGGHKGSAISLMVEMLASGLSGARLTQEIHHAGFTDPEAEPRSGNDITVGNFFLVIDSDIFGDGDAVRHRAGQIASYVRQSPSQPSHGTVLAPGDPELMSFARAQSHGINLLPRTAASLRRLAGELDVSIPDALEETD